MSHHRMPSTPNGRSMGSNAPSTTPAGPPPTWLTDHTTTPEGHPPARSTFNSSFNPGNDTFRRSHGPSTFTHNKHASFSVPDDDDEDEDDDMEGEEEDGYDRRAYERQGEEEESEVEIPFMNSLPSAAPSVNTRGLKRSHDGRVQVREATAMAGIARRLTNNQPRAELHEADKIILQSQEIVAELDAKVRRAPREADGILLETAAQLTKLWSTKADAATRQGALGPQSSDPFTIANYMATLLLQLHHPHTANPQAATRSSRPSARPNHGTTVPKGLLDWLNKYHLPFPDDFGAIHIYQPAPAAHESFWDVIYASALRGKLDRVVSLLRDGGWEHAVTALDDGSPDPGYSGHQLSNTEAVISACIRTIEGCPGYQHNDWDVKGVEWNIFRQRTRAALDDLEEFAEGENLDHSQAGGNAFERSMRGSHLSLSTASRRAESKVPWSIYENLKLLYGLLLGSTDEILMTAQDWLEASLYLTVWWDGLGSDDHGASLGRSGMQKSTVQRTREVDIAPLAAYRRRLVDALMTVTDDPQDTVFAVDTLDPVQVGIACVLDDSVGNAVRMLRKYSMPIAISVVEIAALGDWLPLTRPRSGHNDLLDQGFSREDLLVLSHGPVATNPDDIDRDEFLCEYAELLSDRQQIGEHEGWELAVAVLNRLDESSSASPKIASLLDRISLVDSARVDKVLSVCEDLEQLDQLRDIAERYADSLAQDTATYGDALIYYARARSVNKLKSNLNHLTGLCLLHSTSTPPIGGTDHKLEALINKDRLALRSLAEADMEAATLLSSHLSGYATLRQFFDLRDASEMSSLARRRAAATALFAVITSAADCIPGGLFDPEAETAIPAEGLLNLFGECLPLLGSGDRVFTEKQVFALLGLVEDWQACPGRIHEEAGGLLAASLGAYREEASLTSGPLTRQKKKEIVGNGDMGRSVGSSWDVLSMELAEEVVKNGGEGLRRGWDWRKGVVGLHEVDLGERQIVGLVREGLVREVAAGWSGGLGW